MPIAEADKSKPLTRATFSFSAVDIRRATRAPNSSPTPQHATATPNAVLPPPSATNSGYSAIFTIPVPKSESAMPAAQMRSAGVENSVSNPARRRRRGAPLPSDLVARKLPRTRAITPAAMRNEAAFTRNDAREPAAATSTPPNRAPRSIPPDPAIERKAFAHARSFSGTNEPISAPAAGANGDSARAVAAPSTTMSNGERAVASAVKAAAAAIFEAIMTCRRSNRSPISPAHGATMRRVP